MGLAYNPTARTIRTRYVVAATGDQWFIPTTGYGDNPGAGTEAQRVTQCSTLCGSVDVGGTDTPVGSELVAS